MTETLAQRRAELLTRLRAKIARGEAVVGGGAGTGLSAKCEEAGGIDLIVIYNSGRYRMAGRGSLAGLMAYGNANEIVLDMAREVLPVVRHTPVLAGVNGTDPFVLWDDYFDRLERLGFAGVQNFPTVGLFDGQMRQQLEETGMGYGLEVEMIARAHARGMLTTPYVFNPREAVQMAEAGADIIVVHMGLTAGGSIGAATTPSLDASVALFNDCEAAVRGGARRRHHDLPRRSDRRARARRAHARALPGLPWLLRRVEHGAAAHRAGAHRADAALHRPAHHATRRALTDRRPFNEPTTLETP